MEIIVLILVALVAGIIMYSAAKSAVNKSEKDAEALVLMRRRMSEDYQRQQRVNAASEAEQALALRNRYAGANTTPTPRSSPDRVLASRDPYHPRRNDDDIDLLTTMIIMDTLSSPTHTSSGTVNYDSDDRPTIHPVPQPSASDDTPVRSSYSYSSPSSSDDSSRSSHSSSSYSSDSSSSSYSSDSSSSYDSGSDW